MTDERRPTVSVIGVGTADVTPDRLLLQVGAEARAADAGQALDELGERLAALMRVLDAAGVPGGDRRTSSISTHSFLDRTTGREEGIVAAVAVHVVVADIGGASRLLADLAAAVGPAFRVRGLTWFLAEPEAARAQARGRAVEAARRQASELATHAGVSLGPVLSIEEPARTEGHWVSVAALDAAPASAGPPLEPGSGAVTVAVRLEYALD